MDDRRLGRIVHRLRLRDVGDVAGHGRRGDEAPVPEVVKRLPVRRRALLLLPPPVQRGGAGAVERAVDVDAQHLLHCLDGPIDEGAVLPGDARVGDEDVEAPVEVLDDFVDGIAHGFPRLHIDRVCLACIITIFVSVCERWGMKCHLQPTQPNPTRLDGTYT